MFHVDVSTGLVRSARQCASPNQDARPDPCDISLLVIHCISLPPGEFGGDYVDALFCNRLDVSAHPYFTGLEGLKVSSHLMIDRQGQVTQYVPLCRRAWHAGVSCWEGRERCNDFAVGIELEGTDTTPYSDAQYATLVNLTRTLQAAYPAIVRERIVGHSDIAPGRKTDPGPAFDWERYLAGLTPAS